MNLFTMNFLKKLQPGIETLKHLDVYSKPIEDFRVKTVSGGTASVVCYCIIIFLLMKRCYEFCCIEDTVETIFVDTSRSTKLRINIDFIVPAISCDYLALDAMDTSGEQHLHIEHNMFKRRLDLAGNPIEDPKREEGLGSAASKHDHSKQTNELAEVKCGSCYGAEDPARNITCCNTCEEVKEAYEYKRWKLSDLELIEQCRSSHDVEKIRNALKEGCQIYGYMEVNRVGGSFHIAPGQSFSVNHVHVHDVQPFSSTSFNTSHIIRHLSFGRNKLLGKTNPLDGTESHTDEGASMFQYYIKIVPTMRVLKDGSVFHSNQFSVTKHQKVVSPASGDSGMPGIFFSYELSALMVKITDKVVYIKITADHQLMSFGMLRSFQRTSNDKVHQFLRDIHGIKVLTSLVCSYEPWSHFINDCCCCIGGVFIVFMLLDSFFYRSVEWYKKMELGKAQ